MVVFLLECRGCHITNNSHQLLRNQGLNIYLQIICDTMQEMVFRNVELDN